ncbi:hypothetical protein Neosp_011099 [[Neocosmospora] mangrovei]
MDNTQQPRSRPGVIPADSDVEAHLKSVEILEVVKVVNPGTPYIVDYSVMGGRKLEKRDVPKSSKWHATVDSMFGERTENVSVDFVFQMMETLRESSR